LPFFAHRLGTILVFGTLYYQSFAKKDSKHGSKHGVGSAPEKESAPDMEAVKPLLDDGVKEAPK